MGKNEPAKRRNAKGGGMSDPKPLQNEKREGWIGTTNSRKWHYIIGNDPLCGGGAVLLGIPELGNDNSPDNCKACKRKLQERRAKASKL